MPLLKWKKDDQDAEMIQKNGPLCAVFEADIWKDPDAVNALASDDNLNATVQMGEDEMQAFGRVDTMYGRMVQTQRGGKTCTSISEFISKLEASGLSQSSKH